MSEWLGWHFSVNRRCGYDDGRLIRRGVTHRVKGPVVLCQHGLHASARAIDALDYAPAATTHVARVRLSGEIVHGEDKSVAIERTYLAVLPVTSLLHEFACQCAEAALMIADVDDERCWQAIHVKREWLAGRARDADLAAAWAAAGASAWAAAGAAAGAAARDAARAAAGAAAGDAAWAAAWDAARAAARAAAWAAARDAARDAAGAAAGDAAWAEMNDLLESLLADATGCAQ